MLAEALIRGPVGILEGEVLVHPTSCRGQSPLKGGKLGLASQTSEVRGEIVVVKGDLSGA